MNFSEILTIAVRLHLPIKDIDTITEYLDYNEWGMALEILCSAIEYDKIPISRNDYIQIKWIGESMRMDKELWEVFEC